MASHAVYIQLVSHAAPRVSVRGRRARLSYSKVWLILHGHGVDDLYIVCRRVKIQDASRFQEISGCSHCVIIFATKTARSSDPRPFIIWKTVYHNNSLLLLYLE